MRILAMDALLSSIYGHMTTTCRSLTDSSSWKCSIRHTWCSILQAMVVVAVCCLPITPVHARTRQEILRELLGNDSLNMYDSSMPPHYDEDVPTNVSVQIYVLSFDSVTEAAMVNNLATTSYLQYTESQGGGQQPPPFSDGSSGGMSPAGKGTHYGHQHHNNRRTLASGSKDDSTQEQRGFEFSMSIFLRQNWSDPRLEWSDPNISDRLEVDPKMMNHVWVPDLYFINEREAVMHDVTVANKLLHINPDGAIVHSVRVSMTLSCDMFLDRYPHDEQVCSLCIGSYSFSSENVVFKWVDNPVIMRPEMTLPRFQVNFQKVKECDYLFTEESSTILGNYSCIQADFYLKREFGYYIAQVYVPSILIVMLSWVSFWIDIEATPARVSLGLLTVLTITTQSTGEKAALPRVSYIKAIDVWMSTCLFFVFAALLEFAFVNTQNRVEKRRQGEADQCNNTNTSTKPHEGSRTNNSSEKEAPQPVSTVFNRRESVTTKEQHNQRRVQKARMTDKISRIAFPTAFAIFNLIYWIYYR